MGQACDPRFGKGSALASRVRPVAVPLQFGQQLTNYSHLRLMMQAQNNSSLMLNNFTTSIYFTGTFEQFQEAERWWDGVSLSNLQLMKHNRPFDLDCSHFWGFAKFGWWGEKKMVLYNLGGDNSAEVSTLTSSHFRPFSWAKCSSANQSRKYEKSVEEIGFGAGKKSASAAKVWRRILDFLSGLIGCFVPRKKEDWPFWEGSLDGSQFVIIINGLWSLDAESH